MADLSYIDMGRCSYEDALRLQLKLAQEVQDAQDEKAYLLLVEHHPPVITLGVGADAENVLAGPDRLSMLGIAVHKTKRGGDVTYHGPGQLVGYPILRLGFHGRSIRKYLRDLEEVLIRALAVFDVDAGRREGMTGVWVGEEKIAAIGVAIRRWVSYHGFALNVNCNLEHFRLIVPCGLAKVKVTSLSELLGRAVRPEQVTPHILKAMLEVFGFSALRQRPAQ